jgi:hypothetical protein
VEIQTMVDGGHLIMDGEIIRTIPIADGEIQTLLQMTVGVIQTIIKAGVKAIMEETDGEILEATTVGELIFENLTKISTKLQITHHD